MGLSNWIKELVKDHILGNPTKLVIMFYLVKTSLFRAG